MTQCSEGYLTGKLGWFDFKYAEAAFECIVVVANQIVCISCT